MSIPHPTNTQQSAHEGYTVAVSSMMLDGKLPVGDPRWPQLTQSYLCMSLAPTDLAWYIQEGRCWTAWVEGSRSDANFLSGQTIALDFDKLPGEFPTLDNLSAHPFIELYASLLHETPSSTPSAPRARVIFMLDEAITQAGQFRSIIETLLSIFPEADQQNKDAARFYYGNAGCDVRHICKELPLHVLRDVYQAAALQAKKDKRQAAKQRKAHGPPTQDGNRIRGLPIDKMAQDVAGAAEGQRNHMLNVKMWRVYKAGLDSQAEDVAINAITLAARQCGLSDREIETTRRSAQRSGTS